MRVAFALVTMVMVMMRVALVLVRRVDGAFVDGELHTLDFLPLGAVEVQMEVAQRELGELPLQRGRTDAEIDERADHHVAADA